MIVCDCGTIYDSDKLVPETCSKCGASLRVESKTKKCGNDKRHGNRPAVGVISYLKFHTYVCLECAKKAEKDGLFVDYANWRLS